MNKNITNKTAKAEPGFSQTAPGFGQVAPGFATGFGEGAPTEVVTDEELATWTLKNSGWNSYFLKPNGTKVTNLSLRRRYINRRNAEDAVHVERFTERLPKIPSVDELFGELEFFGILKNGNRVPLASVCEEVERDSEGSIIRSADDRLLLIVEALKRGELYWRQAFYLSTGTSSRMAGTWLPFSGIQYESGYRGLTQIFAKDEYTHDVGRAIYIVEGDLDTKLDKAFLRVFGGALIPEGAGFERFAAPSYFLASYRLGGNEFVGDKFQKKYSSKYIQEESPLQSCFADPKKFPMVNAKAVNDHIHTYEALPIYNLFRYLGKKPIGIQNIAKNSIPIREILFGFNNPKKKTINYKLPSQSLYSALRKYLRKLYIDHLLGKITERELGELVQETSLQKILDYVHDSTVLETEPQFLRSLPDMENVYGGSRKKTRTQKTKRNHTHKHTLRKHRLKHNGVRLKG